MNDATETLVEAGQFGRVFTVRLRPNVDLIAGIQQICADHGLAYAEVRGAIGSLIDAALQIGDMKRTVAGPGLEIALTSGRVAPADNGQPRARLFGLVSDGEGRPYGGEFVRGENPVFVTLELVLHEWIPIAE